MTILNTNTLQATEIKVDPDSLIVICPGCGENQEEWIAISLGKTSQCNECGVEWKVPTQTPITVRY